MTRPLDHITVVSLEHAIAAPLCTRHLADLGARVIKVERPGSGDFARDYDRRARGLASHFVWVNRSKESLTLDLKNPDAMAVLRDLLKDADVLVQNLAPGAAARMGLSFEALSPTHPKLIVCDISGYGEDGPYRDKKAYDLLIQSEAGMLSITGTPEDPSKTGNSIADIAAGMYAYSNILAALLQRGRTGEGSHIDNLCHIGHNCQIGAHTVICGCVGIVGSTTIGRHCVLAGGAGIGGDGPITLCDGVVVSGMTHVSASIDTPGVYSGGVLHGPTRQWKRNALRFGELDGLARRIARLERQLAAAEDQMTEKNA